MSDLRIQIRKDARLFFDRRCREAERAYTAALHRYNDDLMRARRVYDQAIAEAEADFAKQLGNGQP